MRLGLHGHSVCTENLNGLAVLSRRFAAGRAQRWGACSRSNSPAAVHQTKHPTPAHIWLLLRQRLVIPRCPIAMHAALGRRARAQGIRHAGSSGGGAAWLGGGGGGKGCRAGRGPARSRRSASCDRMRIPCRPGGVRHARRGHSGSSTRSARQRTLPLAGAIAGDRHKVLRRSGSQPRRPLFCSALLRSPAGALASQGRAEAGRRGCWKATMANERRGWSKSGANGGAAVSPCSALAAPQCCICRSADGFAVLNRSLIIPINTFLKWDGKMKKKRSGDGCAWAAPAEARYRMGPQRRQNCNAERLVKQRLLKGVGCRWLGALQSRRGKRLRRSCSGAQCPGPAQRVRVFQAVVRLSGTRYDIRHIAVTGRSNRRSTSLRLQRGRSGRSAQRYKQQKTHGRAASHVLPRLRTTSRWPLTFLAGALDAGQVAPLVRPLVACSAVG